MRDIDDDLGIGTPDCKVCEAMFNELLWLAKGCASDRVFYAAEQRLSEHRVECLQRARLTRAQKHAAFWSGFKRGITSLFDVLVQWFRR